MITTGWDTYKYGLTFGVGYKAGPSRSVMEEFFRGTRHRGLYVVDRAGYITSTQITRLTIGLPPDYVSNEGIDILRAAGRLKNIITEIKWSSKTVRDAAKSIGWGKDAVTVATRAEAEELFWGL